MNHTHHRIRCGALLGLALVALATPLRAQQNLGDTGRPPAVASPQAPGAQPPQSPAAGLPDAQVPRTPSAARTPVSIDAGAGASSAADRPERDLSPWSMFLSADILVKVVMVSLAFASLVTWTIFFAMTAQLALARRRLNDALARVADARTLPEAQLGLGPTRGVLSSLLGAALQELRMSTGTAVEGGIKERVAVRFAEIVRAEGRAARHGMGILATIGSTSPFVGLFGTVWGIMNSFIGISKSQTTNLAVVAPGIAEALLATAIGLVAAIPAVIIYNHFSRVTRGYVDLVRRASGTVGRLLSRDLDRTYGQMASRAAE